MGVWYTGYTFFQLVMARKSLFANKYASNMSDAPLAPWSSERIQHAVSGGLVFFCTFAGIFFGWSTMLMIPLLIGALELICAVFGVCLVQNIITMFQRDDDEIIIHDDVL